MNPASYTVQAFYGLIRKLEVASKQVAQAMESNRLKLQEAYSEARRDADPANSRARMALLAPLIHENSKLRLRYKALAANFNTAVSAVREALKRAGLADPGRLGIAPLLVLVPIGAVAAYGVSVNILRGIEAANRAQTEAVEEAVRISRDDSETPEEKDAARATLYQKAKQAPPPGGDPFGIGSLVPILGIVAAIMLGPQLLQAFKARKGTA